MISAGAQSCTARSKVARFKRDQSVRAAAEAWRWQDKAAALAAITRASIPENMRASLVAKIEKQD
jgi:hypothetical protein